MDLDIEQFYRTNDMALVTFLKMNGHPVQTTDWASGTCYWIFRVTDKLIDETEDFSDGRGRVDPREYNRMFGLVKREFYDSKRENENS